MNVNEMKLVEQLAEYQARYAVYSPGSLERGQLIAEFIHWNWAPGREPFNANTIAQLILER